MINIIIYLTIILYISILSSLIYIYYNIAGYILTFFVIYLLLIDLIIINIDNNKNIQNLENYYNNKIELLKNEIYIHKNTNNILIEKNKKIVDILWKNINKNIKRRKNSYSSVNTTNTLKKNNSYESFLNDKKNEYNI